MKHFLAIYIVLFLLCFGSTNSHAQTPSDTLSILFVGNSYTYFENLPQIVSLISDQTDTKLLTKKSTVGGAKLREHWHGNRGLKSKKLIQNGDFDIVVLQEFSMGAINNPDSLSKYAKLLCDLIKEHDATPYLYQTWAREKVPQYQKVITREYEKVAKENNAAVAPVGEAWALARELRPNIKLYNPDGSHPSSLGTFLAACVFVASITNELPEKLNGNYKTTDKQGETIELMSIHPLDLVFFQKIVDEVVFEND